MTRHRWDVAEVMARVTRWNNKVKLQREKRELMAVSEEDTVKCKIHVRFGQKAR